MSNNHYFETYDSDYSELRMRDLNESRYRSAYRAHSNCADPDHPGCEECEGDDNDE